MYRGSELFPDASGSFRARDSFLLLSCLRLSGGPRPGTAARQPRGRLGPGSSQSRTFTGSRVMGKAGDPCERVSSAQSGAGRVSRRNSSGFRTAGLHASIPGTVYQPRAGGPGAHRLLRVSCGALGRPPLPTPQHPSPGPGASAAAPHVPCPGHARTAELTETTGSLFGGLCAFLSPQPFLGCLQGLPGLRGSARAPGASDPAYSGFWHVLCCSPRDSLASRKRLIEPQFEPWSTPSFPVHVCPGTTHWRGRGAAERVTFLRAPACSRPRFLNFFQARVISVSRLLLESSFRCSLFQKCHFLQNV